MVQICDSGAVDINARCVPSGAQLGFSFRPSPCVNCVYLRDATSMMNMLNRPAAYPRVHANAMICPSGCQEGLDASPVAWSQPFDVRPIHIHPVNLLRAGRPETNTISFPVLGLTLGSASMKLKTRSAARPLPSKFAM